MEEKTFRGPVRESTPEITLKLGSCPSWRRGKDEENISFGRSWSCAFHELVRT